MRKKTLEEIVQDLPPEKAIEEIAVAARNLLGVLDEKARLTFLMHLIGDAAQDKVSSLVHL